MLIFSPPTTFEIPVPCHRFCLVVDAPLAVPIYTFARCSALLEFDDVDSLLLSVRLRIVSTQDAFTSLLKIREPNKGRSRSARIPYNKNSFFSSASRSTTEHSSIHSVFLQAFSTSRYHHSQSLEKTIQIVSQGYGSDTLSSCPSLLV